MSRISKFLLGLSVINFIAVFVCAFFIPAQAVWHINSSMQVDLLGSPWWNLLLGVLPVVIAVCLIIQEKNRRI